MFQVLAINFQVAGRSWVLHKVKGGLLLLLLNYIYNLRQMTPKLNLHILFDLPKHVAQKIADKITILITEIRLSE